MSQMRFRGVKMQTAEEKLADLGCDEREQRLYTELISQASTPEELKREMGKRHFSCDTEQFLLPIFRKLYQQDENFKSEAIGELKGLGIPEDIIDTYFTKMGNQPYLPFRLGDKEFQHIPSEARYQFTLAARETMLRKLRLYFGFE